MEMIHAELEVLGATQSLAIEAAVTELAEVELALVGGGNGVVIFP